MARASETLKLSARDLAPLGETNLARLHVQFELAYDAFEANGVKVSEVKRITLDAGSQLDRFRSLYRTESGSTPVVSAIGLKQTTGAQKDFAAATASLTIREKVAKSAGNQGLAVVLEPKTLGGEAADKLNHLLLAQLRQVDASVIRHQDPTTGSAAPALPWRGVAGC